MKAFENFGAPWGRALLLLVVGALAVGACSTRATGPRATLRAVAEALRRGDAAAVYANMSARYRERVPLAELERLIREHPEEIAQTAEALERPLAVEELAVARLGRGETVHLERREAGWRVVSNVLDPYARRTPREAIRAFVRALERRRYDVVVGLIAPTRREGLSEQGLREHWDGRGREEVERLVASLREALETSPVQQTGDRAVMPHGDRFRITLVREGELWYVEDPE